MERSDEDNLQGLLLAKMLDDYYPPTLRNDIYEREVLFEKYNQAVDSKLSIGETGIVVSRSTLYAAAREAFTKGSSVQLNFESNDDEKQKLIFEPNDDCLGAFSLVFGRNRIRLFDLWMLTPDVEIRSAHFERLSKKYNLHQQEFDELLGIVQCQDVSDRNVDILVKAFENTPERSVERISEDIQHLRSDINSLVPSNIEYYIQLVGPYNSASNFKEFLNQQWLPYLQGHLKPEAFQGLKMALHSCAHQSVAEMISKTSFESKLSESVLSSVAETGDLISKIGAVEYIVPHLPDHPEFKKHLVSIIRQLRDDDPENESGLYNSFSQIFAFVEGELSRSKLFESYAPFYRRFASITQASLIQEVVLNSNLKVPHFTKWAADRGAQRFYFQSLFDLRFEPFWIPEYSNPAQWKSEIVGRFYNIANGHINIVEDDEELKFLLLNFEQEGLKKFANSPGPFIPGPLEGHESMTPEAPKDLQEKMKAALESETVDYGSFVLLINLSRLFRLNTDHADRAIKALKEAHENLLVEKGEHFYDLILGFASVSGVTKSTELADFVRVLIRKFNNLVSSRLNPTEVFRIAIIAAAAHDSLEEWCNYVGDFTFELANSKFDDEHLEQFYSSLRCLLDVVPELWATCGNSERALFSMLA